MEHKIPLGFSGIHHVTHWAEHWAEHWENGGNYDDAQRISDIDFFSKQAID